MAFTVTDAGQFTTTATLFAFPVTLGVAIPAGALIVAIFSEDGATGSGIVVPTDDAGNTWNLGPNIKTGVGSAPFVQLVYTYTGNALSIGQKITFTRKASGDEASAIVFYITGHVAGVDPYDSIGSATASGSSATPGATSGAYSTSGNIEVAAVMMQGAASTQTKTAEDADFTNTPPTPVHIAGGGGHAQTYAAVRNPYAGTAADTYQCTLSTSGSWAALIVGFKVATASDTAGMMDVFE